MALDERCWAYQPAAA